jgi:hypothetical protein
MGQIKKYITLVLLCLTNLCFGQKQDIVGTYINRFTDDIGFDGCCHLIEVLRLNTDKTFHIYQRNDQGDYEISSVSYGDYKIVGDSILFIPKIDATRKLCSPHDQFSYSGYRMKILKSSLKSLNPIRIVAGGLSEKVRYKKLNFKNFDSLKISFDKSDSSQVNESFTIKKDKTLRYDFSSFNRYTRKTTTDIKNIILDNFDYNLFINKLSESPLLELPFNPRSNKNYSLNLCIDGDNFSNYGWFCSESLYNFVIDKLVHK